MFATPDNKDLSQGVIRPVVSGNPFELAEHATAHGKGLEQAMVGQVAAFVIEIKVNAHSVTHF